MKNFILFLLAILIMSCKITDKGVSEKDFLKLQIDSLKQLNENLTTTHPFLFEKALNLEKSDKETAISIYKTIANTKNGDFWAIESEKRILNLTKEEIKKINTKFVFIEDFDWLCGDTLELFQQNDKCGKWGGDIERIRIFRKIKKASDSRKEEIVGYYTKECFDCDTLSRVGYLYDKAIPTIYKSKEIEFTTQQRELLKEAILDLAEHRLNNFLPFGHSGIVNKVQVVGNDKYSKIIYISDYPSFNWNKFHKLKKEIEELIEALK